VKSVMENPYKTLGVAHNASEKDIKKSYRKLAHKYHPDRNSGHKGAEAKFQSINAAYEVIGDKDKRKLYDEFGAPSLQSGFNADQARRYGSMGSGDSFFQNGQGGGGFEDIFSRLFQGGAGQAPRQRARRGRDTQCQLSIDFLTSIKGGSKTLHIGGEIIEVDVPAGIRSGQKIRLAGKGGSGTYGAPDGDLKIEIKVLDHPVFKRDGADIHFDVPVTMLELVIGAPISVDVPDGSIELNIPPLSQNGRKLRVKGLGVPARDGSRGNLYIHLKLVLPETDDARLVELAGDIDKLYKRRPRSE
jgi:DnaJ-class molecular chaperone